MRVARVCASWLSSHGRGLGPRDAQLEKNHVVPTAWQDEALARDGVSREVRCSALKGETVPDSLPATPKSPPTRLPLELFTG